MDFITAHRRVASPTGIPSGHAIDFLPYFHEVELKTIEVREVPFTAVLGRGFKYAAYRDDVLARVRSRYYAIPAALPQNGCSFCDRYFPGMPCTR